MLGGYALTWILVLLQVMGRLVTRERRNLGRMGHLVEDENLRCGNLMVLMVPSEYRTMQQA